MKKLLLTMAAIMLAAITLQAQIPAEVTNVMNKSRAVMSNPAGLEYTLTIKTNMGPVTLFSMNSVMGEKGERKRVRTDMKALGVEIVSESGFDGTQYWEIKHNPDADTIILSKTSTQKKNESDVDFNFDKKYKKAKLKQKDDYYEIVFSEPKDKAEEAKSVTVKVSSKNYYMREIKTSARGAHLVMSFSKYRIGLKDDYFKIDLSKYPKAVVVRK